MKALEWFNAREKSLDQLIMHKLKDLAKESPGSLRIDNSRGRAQYYLYQPGSEKPVTYISKKNTDLIKELAQQQYDREVVKAAGEEKRVIEWIREHYPEKTPESIYDALSPERRALVTPIVETDEEYAEKWLAVPFTPNSYPKEDTGLVTERGEVARTRAEYIIANELYKNGVPYRYEAPLYLRGRGTVYPDFTVLNVRTRKEYVWEHMGMLTDPDYADDNLPKLESYEENGYFPGENMILTVETLNPRTGKPKINVNLIRKMIGKYCL